MFNTDNAGIISRIDFVEWSAFFLWMSVILLCSFFWQIRRSRMEPAYRYYTAGMAAKLGSGLAFCLIYIYYYPGGDTICYYETGRAMVNLFERNPSDFFQMYFSGPSLENYYLFSSATGYPWWHLYFDPKTLFFSKMLVPLLYVSFNSYLVATLLLAWLSYMGTWRLYLLFARHYPGLESRIAIATLFLPSVLFWGSGMLKDTVTLAASCWYIYSFYYVFIDRKRWLRYLPSMLLSLYVVLAIKSYIVMALIPGAVVWFFHDYIRRIPNRWLRWSAIPLMYACCAVVGYGLLTVITEFDVEQLIQEARVKQLDLQRDEYRGTAFNIGTFEPTVEGALGVAPAAMTAGLYRPFVWETNSAVMLLAGVENFFYLLLTAILVWRRRTLRLLFNQPLILFCISYAVLFSLIVGLSTSNFGALVRFKIAFLPQLACSLILLYSLSGKKYRSRL